MFSLRMSLLRLGGKTYGGCLPDASQMPPSSMNPSLCFLFQWFLVYDFVPPLPPLCCRCLDEISLVKKYLVKKSHEKWSAKYCKFGSQMGCQIGPEIEDNVNNAFDGGWQSQVSTTRIKKWWKIVKCRPWKAWFWCPLSSENAVATFPDLLEMSSTWHPNGLQIGAGGCLWDQKVGKSGVWKT